MEKIYTPGMAAETLHVSTGTVKNWLRSGRLQGIKAGRQWRIRESDLEQFINQGRPDPDRDKASNQ
jgi:excisionase family DNA binding protein